MAEPGEDENHMSGDEELVEGIVVGESLRATSSCKVIFLMIDMMGMAPDEGKKNVGKSMGAAAYMVTIAVEAAHKTKTPVTEIQMALGGFEKGTLPHIA